MKRLFFLLLPCAFVVGLSIPAYSEEIDSAVRSEGGEVVLTGLYRCPAELRDTDFAGNSFGHGITFTTTGLGELRIETAFNNLDVGDCTPRGNQSRALAQELGCTVGPLHGFRQSGGDLGSGFGFVCKVSRRRIINIIDRLSRDILTPTGPG
jgi:hypothetical protein